MWIRFSGRRMEIAAPCGCLQAFLVTPAWEIERSALAGRCGKDSCEYNYFQLRGVAERVIACLRKTRSYQPEPAASASDYAVGG